jgi:hypothetical protein
VHTEGKVSSSPRRKRSNFSVKLKSILSRANHPFIIVTQNGLDAGILERIIANKAIPLKKISFPETG